MKQGLVISDLHLFAQRSVGERLVADLRGEFAHADVLVLNGDIFDFSWSRLPSEEASITAALAWLRGLAGDFAGREVHYILGNHDCLTAFRDALDGLVRDCPALRCHEHSVRLGRHLFLHGDCANRKMCGEALAKHRRAWSRERSRTRVHAAMYEAVDTLGISRGFHRCYFPTVTTVKRVAHHLDHVLPAWREEIDDCYFGHTHQPFRAHTHEGVRFHNTGSGIRGMRFQPLQFELSPEGY